jgi:hypothetical protein
MNQALYVHMNNKRKRKKKKLKWRPRLGVAKALIYTTAQKVVKPGLPYLSLCQASWRLEEPPLPNGCP